MRIERYLEQDMRKAMRRVSDELGADAVIVSTGKAGDLVEVVAAADYDEALYQSLRPEGSSPAGRETPQTSAETTAPPPVSVPVDNSLKDLKTELSRLRGLFEGELSELTWQEKARRQPGRMIVQKRLEELGLSRAVCASLLDCGICNDDPEQSWQLLCQALARSIPICGADILEHGGTIALVGPTGVGKTTTVAKLAARFALRHGRNHVGLISTDRFRAGAQEQLYTFASIMGVPVQAAGTSTELSRSLDGLADRKLVLVDTAGMSQRDIRLADQFVTLAGADPEMKTYLVLSAIAQQQVLNEAVQAFSHMGLSGAIITKTDEAVSLGPVISTLLKFDLPAAFIGNGQRVPEDLRLARGETMVEEALALVAHGNEGNTSNLSSPSSVHA